MFVFRNDDNLRDIKRVCLFFVLHDSLVACRRQRKGVSPLYIILPCICVVWYRYYS